MSNACKASFSYSMINVAKYNNNVNTKLHSWTVCCSAEYSFLALLVRNTLLLNCSNDQQLIIVTAYCSWLYYSHIQMISKFISVISNDTSIITDQDSFPHLFFIKQTNSRASCKTVLIPKDRAIANIASIFYNIL